MREDISIGTPLVSVVIPAYNAAATVGESVRSVERQTLGDLEVIVVDDGSTDDTAAVVDGLGVSCPLTLIRTPNSGPSAARNTGARAARARYVAFLDSDDLWLPGYLETMMATLGEDGGLAFTDAWVVDAPTGRVRRRPAMGLSRPLPADAHALVALLLERNFVYTSVTVRRDLLLESGGYDERLWMSEDYELWLRLAASGCVFRRAAGCLAIRRNRPGSLTSDLVTLFAGNAEVYRLVAETYDLPDELRAQARAQEARSRRTLARLEGEVAGARRRRLVARARDVVRALRPDPWLGDVPPEVADTLAHVAG